MKRILIPCLFFVFTASSMEVTQPPATTKRKKVDSRTNPMGEHKTVFYEIGKSRYNSNNSDYAIHISYDCETKKIIGSFISRNAKKVGISYILTLEKKLNEPDTMSTLYKGIKTTSEAEPSKHKVKLLVEKMQVFEKKHLQKSNR